MTFEEILAQVREQLQREGRVAYRILKRRFALSDDDLEDLKAELIDAKRLAVDEKGKVLVWIGAAPVSGSEVQVSSSLSPPTPRTPNPELRTPDPSLQTLDARLDATERRQLTVMFCDLVDSSVLSAQLDPEELREAVGAYQETCEKVIRRYDGHIAQYLGDGLVVYFGYPVAHEDDAQRTVRTGLEILAGLQSLNAGLPPTIRARLPHPLQVRIGIHTGVAVIGEIGSVGRHEILALGETPNVAARLQGLAAPDTVVISAATARLVQNVFALEDLGTRQLKGMTEPLALARVLSLRETERAEEDTRLVGVPFLVGRDEEIGFLRGRWEQCKAGLGQVVLITGEPGIGKTTLVETLRAEVRREGVTRLTFRCSPYYQNSALYPVIELLQRLLQFERSDSPATRLEKLERVLATYRFPFTEAMPLFAALLSVPVPEGRYPALGLTPQQQKQQMHDALVALLMEEAERQPVLAVWEDLQWADPSTLEWLELVIGQTPTMRMLAVLTFRPDFLPPWPTRPHMTLLTLHRLERPQVEAVVRHLVGGKALPAEVIQQIVSKTDGVPLFVEELTKMVVESTLLRPVNGHYELSGPLPPLAIPATLQDSLMARLDRLSEVREVVQLGAVLGREFAYAMLRMLMTIDESTLQARLAQLVAAELLYQRGRPPRARYVFKHALIQDAAYASMLKSTRQRAHQQIAQLFVQHFAEIGETQPEVVAHHYTEAGLTEQAILYWQRAGQRAIERSANTEAVSHLTKGLELLKILPDSPERTQQELALQIPLGVSLVMTKGYAAPDVGKAYARARELCQQAGQSLHLLPVLWGLWQFYIVRAELQTAYELGEQLLTAAQHTQDSAFFVGARQALGVTLFHLGELDPAYVHLEQGATLYNLAQHRSLAFLFGQDPGVACRSFAALVLWLRGYPKQAVEKLTEALALAQQLAHPFSRAFTCFFAAWLFQLRREEQGVQEYAEALLTLSHEQGFLQWLAMGPILRGWALAEQKQGDEGLARIRQGLAAFQPTGAQMLVPYFLALLAETHGKVGQTDEGLTRVAEALDIVNRTGERFYEAELYRLAGELSLQEASQKSKIPDPQSHILEPQLKADAYFLKAIEIARTQQAKSLELRAVISLSRLRQQQATEPKARPTSHETRPRLDEARQMLAEVYGWFTEGFDTKDLQEAKTLLEELTH